MTTKASKQEKKATTNTKLFIPKWNHTSVKKAKHKIKNWWKKLKNYKKITKQNTQHTKIYIEKQKKVIWNNI